MQLRDLPSVDELARDRRLAGAPPSLAVEAARSVLARAREEIAAGRSPETWPSGQRASSRPPGRRACGAR